MPHTASFLVSSAAFLALSGLHAGSALKASCAFVSHRSPHGAPPTLPGRRTLPSSSITEGTMMGAASSSTALSANMFDRITRVAKGNVNNVLRSMEDPEKILNQAMEDMQADLVRIRQSYADVSGTQRRLKREKESADRLADEWQARAKMALSQGNEEMARGALTQRQGYLEKSSGLNSQLESQSVAMDRLYDGMQELESRILEASGKTEQMIARARTAKSTQQVNDMLTGMTGKTSMDAFRKMEEKVEGLEAAAEVSAEMKVFGLPAASSSDRSTEREFKMLEASSDVDAELKRMKQNLLVGSKGEEINDS